MKKEKFCVELFEKKENENIYGVKCKSNDKSISKDIFEISQKYYDLIDKKNGEIIPFFVLSKDYNEKTKAFELFIGGLIQNVKLESITIPKGLYAKIIVKPKLKFIWGLAIGEVKRYFYTKWIPNNEYVGLNMNSILKRVLAKDHILNYFFN